MALAAGDDFLDDGRVMALGALFRAAVKCDGGDGVGRAAKVVAATFTAGADAAAAVRFRLVALDVASAVQNGLY